MRLVLLMFATVSLLAAGIACTNSQMSGNNAGERVTANKAPSNSAASPSPVAVQMTPVPDGVERISLEDAKKDFDNGNAVFVDVRATEAFNQQHIQGALNITPDKIDENLSKLPKGKKIIIYCS